MTIHADEVIAKLEALNLTVTVMNDKGRTAIYADGSTGTIAGVIAEAAGEELILTNDVEVFTFNGYADEVIRSVTCQGAEDVVELVKEVIGITEALPHRRVISVTDAEAKLEALGYKVVTEHTGGGTFTMYLNRNGGAPFALGPITSHVVSEMFLTTFELAYGLDDNWVDDVDPENFWFGAGENIEDVFAKLDSLYSKMESTGKYPRRGGGEFPLPTYTGDELKERMSSGLLN